MFTTMRLALAFISLLGACITQSTTLPTLSGANPDLSSEPTALPDTSQCVVPGTYRMHATAARNEPATCGHAHVESVDEGDTITVTVVDGRVGIGIGGTAGICAGGVLHGCELTTKCDVQGTRGAATLQLELAFQPNGFGGTFDALSHPPSGECRLVETVAATRVGT